MICRRLTVLTVLTVLILLGLGTAALRVHAESENLVTKTWPMPPAVLRNGSASVHSPQPPPPPQAASPLARLKLNQSTEVDLREFLGSVGIPTAVGGTASYSPKNQILSVTSTPEHIQKIDLLVEKWEKQTQQAALLKTVRELAPEEKQRLAENLKQWASLTAEQKQSLRQRDGLIRKQASEEAASVEKELPEERREAFHKRYFEARKQLEAELRSEYANRRKAALGDLLQKIKGEVLSSPISPATTGSEGGGEGKDATQGNQQGN